MNLLNPNYISDRIQFKFFFATYYNLKELTTYFNRMFLDYKLSITINCLICSLLNNIVILIIIMQDKY